MTTPFNFSNSMMALFSVIALSWVLESNAEDQKNPADGKTITTAKGELGDLLRKWYAEGTAAGNTGDVYDNRDRTHSELNRGPFPQLQKWQYPKEELDKRLDWAFFGGVRPGIVFGNSSTSAGAYEGGSNPRQAYVNPRGLEVLYQQYRGNNVYMYPEHRDHDPGHNGVGDGYGDLYPTNTPFVLISQGSSGSDQPFMHAVPYTLAAFRPEVKKKLAETGLLMPTIQMLFRFTSKRLGDPAKEYLSGKAHTTVFEGSWVDDLKMAQMAHAITLDNIPPIALLKVQEEDTPLDGLDFFEPGATEKLADTPVVVARIFRAKQYAHRMVVSAESSMDVNKRPLTWHWVVLRGDPSRIKINPSNKDGSVAEILVSYHERRPIEEKSTMESNRVDIGVFVNNGTYYSAPSFITFDFLDHEARVYDTQGRILEMGYKTGETQISISDWNGFFALLKDDAAALPARLLRKQFKTEEIAGLLKVAAEYKSAASAVTAAQEQQKVADAAKNKAAAELKRAQETKNAEAAAADALKTAEQQLKSAQTALEAAQKVAREILNKKREDLAGSAEVLVDGALASLSKNPDFYIVNQTDIESFFATPEGKARKGALAGSRNRLVELGILSGEDGKRFELQLLRPGALSSERVTRFEKAMLDKFHGEILSSVLFSNIVRSEFRVNYVPPEISEPPAWRDVYHYNAKGESTGWTRYGGKDPVDFSASGLKILKKDPQGRPLIAQTVKYEPENPLKKPSWPHWRPTLQLPGNEMRYYEYDGEADLKGKLVRTEKLEEKKAESDKK